MFRIIITLYLVIVLISGCSTQLFRGEVTCEQLEQLISHTENLELVQRNAMPEWIRSTFNINEGQIKSDTYGDNRIVYSNNISWQDKDKEYRADFFDQELARIRIHFTRDSITVGQIVKCLGEPEAYLAYKARMIVFEMWYPSRGVIFRAEIINNDQNTSAPIETMETLDVYIFRTSSLQEATTLTSPTLANAEARSKLLKSWTSQWSDIRIESLPPDVIPP